jgi:glycosyltransferase involved in cell wall biosynthesis
MQPYFSIVVPTLNRCDTLKYTIDTIIDQDYESFELIVSDNCSSDQTESIVRAAQKKCVNIKYIKPSRTLSMSQHWEFAIKYVLGKYVAFVGDDDALIPDGLVVSEKLLKETGEPAALSSINAEYHWPSSPIPFHSNIARIPLGKRTIKLDTGESLQKLVKFEIDYHKLPNLYRGWISKNTLDKLSLKTNGVFKSCVPDIYFSIASLGVIDSYYFTEQPIFIEGVSGNSNGAKIAQSVSAEKEFFSDDSIPFHPQIGYCNTIAFIIAECLFQCQDFGLIQQKYGIESLKLIQSALRELQYIPAETYRQRIKIILDYAIKHNLYSECKILVDNKPHIEQTTSPFPNDVWFEEKMGCKLLAAKCNDLGCQSIYDFYNLFKNRSSNGFVISDLLSTIAHQNNQINLNKGVIERSKWMEDSLSWRLTSPLRSFLSWLKQFNVVI